MSAVRRFYLYAVTLISLEMVVWGVVGLLRTIFSSGLIGTGSLLATGLSFVIVGLPIFLFHWRTAQRDAFADPLERGSRVRAVFLYGTQFALLIPVIASTLALVNRILVGLLGLLPSAQWFGRDQSAIDNLLAIVVISLALAYFWRITRSDERAALAEDHLAETRRLFRYLWMLIGLMMFAAGVYNLLRYMLETPGARPEQALSVLPGLAGGIALLLVGLPLWGVSWWAVQDAQVDPEERRSLLRLVILYLISLVSIIGVVSTLAAIIDAILRLLLGEGTSVGLFVRENSSSISLLLPLLVIWFYYGGIRAREVAALSDQPRRAALGRLYFYLLAAIGLAITLGGLYTLIEHLVLWLFSGGQRLANFRDALSSALAGLVVGFPLWWVSWQRMQREAARRDDSGDHARRSVLRKGYLYLAVFLFVVGAMAFAGQILYAILNALLTGQIVSEFFRQLTQLILWFSVDIVLLLYHLRALRQDGKLAQQTLGNLHAGFPTLVIGEEGAFTTQFMEDLRRIAPRLPVALHTTDRGAPDESMLAAKVVVLPLALALDPPESLALWLNEYTGRRLIVPLAAGGYTWLGQVEKPPTQLAHDAARSVRQLAEGETLRQAPPNNPWAIVGYVLGALFGLQLLFFLFALLASLLFQ